MKKILVTGASGFIGSFLGNYFETAGYKVSGMDMRPGNGNDFLVCELPCEEANTFIENNKPDVIVHAAGPAVVSASMEDPYADFSRAVPGTAFLLDCMRRHCPEGLFVLLSSAAVYGNPERMPVEEDSPLAPLSPYGFHKMLNETLCREYEQVYGVRSKVFRIFSAYGEGLPKQVLWDICNKIKRGGDIELFGTGEETRDFVHVGDIANAIGLLIGKPTDEKTFNLASGSSTSIRRIAELIRDELNPAAQIRFNGKSMPGYPSKWEADISRLRALGFSSTINIEDGVRNYARWFRDLTHE